jgi:hypothetical protein
MCALYVLYVCVACVFWSLLGHVGVMLVGCEHFRQLDKHKGDQGLLSSGAAADAAGNGSIHQKRSDADS